MAGRYGREAVRADTGEPFNSEVRQLPMKPIDSPNA
jgi:hypothetical protein